MWEGQVRFENVLGYYVADGVKPCPWGFSCPHIGRAPSAQPPHQSNVLGRVGRSGGGITCAGVPRSSEGFPFPRHVASPHYPSHKRAQRQPEEIHGVALENLAAIPRSQIEGVHGGDGVADEAQAFLVAEGEICGEDELADAREIHAAAEPGGIAVVGGVVVHAAEVFERLVISNRQIS